MKEVTFPSIFRNKSAVFNKKIRNLLWEIADVA